MSHQMELYDEEPFNFEMILNRYLKFVKQSNSVKLSERPVILKAYERIQVRTMSVLCSIVHSCNVLILYSLFF